MYSLCLTLPLKVGGREFIILIDLPTFLNILLSLRTHICDTPLKVVLLYSLQESGGNVLQIESRLSKQGGNKHDFLVHFADDENQNDVFEKIMSNLKPVLKNVGKHGGEKGKHL